MANNRLFLVHRPTGKAVLLGKRLAFGWYTHRDVTSRLDMLYDATKEHSQDDFFLAIEDGDDAPMACEDWEYDVSDDDFTRINLKAKIPSA